MISLKDFLIEAIDLYKFGKEFGSQLYEFIPGYSPNSNFINLGKQISEHAASGAFRLSYTEEIKDGRSSRFDTREPYKLKGKVITVGDAKITIMSIKYDGSTQQDSDGEYSIYIDYWYDAEFSAEYI